MRPVVDDAVGCAAIARACGEDPAGSAPAARRWMAVEHPGPWARHPFEGWAVQAACDEAGVRLQAIRRHGRGATPLRRTVLLGEFDGAGAAWVERLLVDDDAALAALAGAPRGSGEPVAGPVFLVCTHARKDACCAELGRPLARALATAAPDATWETTHLGGDRFAANLLVWPAGIAYGRVPATAARRLVEEARTGRIDPGLLRGRVGASPWASVAEAHVRRRDDLRGATDVTVLAVRGGDDDESAEVDVRTPSGVQTLALSWSPTGRPRPTSCKPGPLADPGGYAVRARVVVRT